MTESKIGNKSKVKQNIFVSFDNLMKRCFGITWFVITNLISGCIVSLLFVLLAFLTERFILLLGYSRDVLDNIFDYVSKIGGISILCLFTIYGVISLGIHIFKRVSIEAFDAKSEIKEHKLKYFNGDLDALGPEQADIINEAENQVSEADGIDLVEDEGDDNDGNNED